MLAHVDDGARHEETMYAMLDAAYAGGTRALCLSPHYQPAFYGENGEMAERAFERLSAYAREKYPDMTLTLANELGYYTDCREAVERGSCRLIGGRYLLMDFPAGVSIFSLRYAMDEMLSAGYSVILAHVERYEALDGKFALLEEWAGRGTLFQINATAFSRSTPSNIRRRVKKLMKMGLVHAVASDAHNLTDRHPSLREAEEIITDRFGYRMAELLLSELPRRILAGEYLY